MPRTTPAQPEDEGEVELNIKEEQGCKCCLSSFQMKLVIIGLELDGVAACSDTSDSVSSLGQWQSTETDPFYMLHITTTLQKQWIVSAKVIFDILSATLYYFPHCRTFTSSVCRWPVKTILWLWSDTLKQNIRLIENWIIFRSEPWQLVISLNWILFTAFLARSRLNEYSFW